MKDEMKELTKDCKALFKEFQQMEMEVKNTVQETTEVAKSNRPHNRYADIGERESELLYI